jgi:hypothetical protein
MQTVANSGKQWPARSQFARCFPKFNRCRKPSQVETSTHIHMKPLVYRERYRLHSYLEVLGVFVLLGVFVTVLVAIIEGVMVC